MANSYQTRRRIPLVVIGLAGTWIAAFLYCLTLSPSQYSQVVYDFALIPVRFDSASAEHFTHWYDAFGPLIGHVFLHAGWLHLGMNTLVFLQAAPWVASRLGAPRFLVLFFLSGLGGAAAFLLINAHGQNYAVGASGAICGVFGAYFLSVRRSWREAIADAQVRNAIGLFLLINVVLAGIASATGFLPIAWEAHLGGFVAGAVAYLLLAPPPPRGPWT